MHRRFIRFDLALSLAAACLGSVGHALGQAPAAATTPPRASAAAPNAVSAPTPSAAQVAAINELFESMKLESQIAALSSGMIDTEVRRDPNLQSCCRDVMLNWLRKYMTWDAMKPELTRAYAEAFTEPELKQLAAFYRTPVGQKSLTAVPQLMQGMVMIGARLGQAHVDELKKLVEQRRAELGQEPRKAPAAGTTPRPTGGRVRAPSTPRAPTPAATP